MDSYYFRLCGTCFPLILWTCVHETLEGTLHTKYFDFFDVSDEMKRFIDFQRNLLDYRRSVQLTYRPPPIPKINEIHSFKWIELQWYCNKETKHHTSQTIVLWMCRNGTKYYSVNQYDKISKWENPHQHFEI